MRNAAAAVLVLLTSCRLAPWLEIERPAGDTIIGGVADTRPYFGTLKTPAGQTVGEFVLATCGCGDWRVLLTAQRSKEQWQFPVLFYSTSSAYDPHADVAVFGNDGNSAVSGIVSQSGGSASGRARRGLALFTFESGRGESHTSDATACVKCHIGEDPVYLQPDNHPRVELSPPNCLTCHKVVITE